MACSTKKKVSAAFVKGNKEGYWDKGVTTKPVFSHMPNKRK